MSKAHGFPRNVNHEIVNWLVVGDIEEIATSHNQYFDEEPGSSLVSVDKPMIAYATFEKRSALL